MHAGHAPQQNTCSTRAIRCLPTHRLHASGRRWVPIVDCGMTALPGQGYDPYDRGLAAGVFIRDSSGQPLVGQVRTSRAHVAGSSGRLNSNNCNWVSCPTGPYLPCWQVHKRCLFCALAVRAVMHRGYACRCGRAPPTGRTSCIPTPRRTGRACCRRCTTRYDLV